ncbi:MAG TPA: serine hydrolase, partial [Candidatus Izemoplasmatales bacterium]|nr:serine hydrolase [Candidatus Izemoplasmatales bacterium]
MIFPHQEFNKISCKEAFVHKQSLLDMFEYIKQANLNIHQMILLHKGSKVFDAYAHHHKDKKENVYSVSKSFTSIAIGILIDQGLLDLDDYVLFYFSDDLDKYHDGYKTLQLKHLLTMTSGQEKDRFHGLTPQHDPVKIYFNTQLTHRPGEHFMYSNFDSLILSAIVTKITGMTLNDFLKANLYEKIGISDVVWPEFSGFSLGCTGLRLSVKDMARFGLLLLNEGRWEDEQIVSKDYIKKATSYQVNTDKETIKLNKNGYGYQFWMNDFGDYKAAGLYNQLLIINRKHGL